MLGVEVIATPELGDRSYIAHDGETALVVDPQRDVERVEAILDGGGLSCALVVETHVHNDYLTGGLELSRRRECEYAFSGEDDVSFDRRRLADGDRFDVGRLSVRVLATPGHTYTHLSYLVEHEDGAPAVFTGGSLLYGSVGRTDLLGTEQAGELARLQYRSVRRLADSLEDAASVYPTHGFGSFCSAGATTSSDHSTIGAERHANPAFTVEDEDAFVERLLSSYGPYPTYYARMAPANRAGPRSADTSLGHIDPDVLRKRIAAGEWVVDLRDRVAYAHAHLAGTFSFPLERALATYFGWLVPGDARVTLIASDDEAIRAALGQLSLIGMGPYGAISAPTLASLADGAGLAGYPVISFAELGAVPDCTIVDVRLDDEWARSHIAGAVHLPVYDVLERRHELPKGQLAVHCGSGYRAAIAASILSDSGYDVLYVNDEWDNVAGAGRQIIGTDAAG